MRAFILALFATSLWLVGCSGAPELELRAWTFVGPDGTREEIVLPAHVDGRLPREATRYTLTREVPLDPALRGHALVLTIPRLLAHTRLRVDARELSAFDGDEPGGYRTRGPHAWRIPADATAGGTLRLELEVEHTWTQSAWLDTPPALTTAPDGGAAYVVRNAWNVAGDAAALGSTLFAAFLYFFVYFSDRRRTTHLRFAITAVCGAAFPLFHSGLAQRILGPAEVTATGVGVVAASVSQVYFTHDYFGQPKPRRAWLVAFGVASIAILATTGYFRSSILAGVIVTIVALPAIVAQSLLLARLARRRPRPPNTFIVLLPWTMTAVLALPDFASWCGLGSWFGGVRGADVGIALIAILQTAALGRDHTVSLRRADELAAEREARIHDLEARKREVEVLNAELRRQIIARSGELGNVIVRLASATGRVELTEGMVVDGRYRVVRSLGEGAGGSVYLVERIADGALFAMKVVRQSQHSHLLARLAREAQLAATVQHENVVAVVDVDVAESGFLFIVIEYVAGDTLRARRSEYGRVDWALDVLRGLAAGLAAVHAHGIVHRDLKPANVLLVDRDGRAPLVKIADFGISGVTAEAAASDLVATMSNAVQRRPHATPDVELTETGVLMGTPLYMAPETVDGAKNPLPTVDIFSFGVIAYELLTARPPFSDSPALAQLEGKTLDPPVPVGDVRPEIPAAVASIVGRCLSFAPSERPTASELVEAFRDARSRSVRPGPAVAM